MADGFLFDIQHYAVHDGPGIRTLVFFKGCPLECAWCCNPESQSFLPQLRYFDAKCKKCFTCAENCNLNAISVQDNFVKRGFDFCEKCEDKLCVELCNYDALRISGKKYSVPEVVDIVSKDIPFYNNSGGGITFSGGEPFSQPEFLLQILKECKNLKIHTAVETCGWCAKEAIEKSLEYVDLFLFDLKIIDEEQHIKYTGKSNKQILENLKFLAQKNKKIIVRLPLIPGITDTSINIKNIISFVNNNQLNEISLEPYHTLGIEKYREHGLNYLLPELKDSKIEEIESVKKIFIENNLNCEIA
jgi:pyruvate formate lyase activating enzyme